MGNGIRLRENNNQRIANNPVSFKQERNTKFVSINFSLIKYKRTATITPTTVFRMSNNSISNLTPRSEDSLPKPSTKRQASVSILVNKTGPTIATQASNYEDQDNWIPLVKLNGDQIEVRSYQKIQPSPCQVQSPSIPKDFSSTLPVRQQKLEFSSETSSQTNDSPKRKLVSAGSTVKDSPLLRGQQRCDSVSTWATTTNNERKSSHVRFSTPNILNDSLEEPVSQDMDDEKKSRRQEMLARKERAMQIALEHMAEQQLQLQLKKRIELLEQNVEEQQDAMYNKVQGRIMKYFDTMKPKGASMSSRLSEHYIDDCKKYFRFSNKVDQETVWESRVLLRKEFEQNRAETHNFGHEKEIDEKLIPKALQNLKKNMVSRVFATQTRECEDESKVFFPTNLDQILGAYDFQLAQKQLEEKKLKKLQQRSENSNSENMTQQQQQQQQQKERMNNPTEMISSLQIQHFIKKNRSESLPKFQQGKMDPELARNFIIDRIPQNKHNIHFRGREPTNRVSTATTASTQPDDHSKNGRSSSPFLLFDKVRKVQSALGLKNESLSSSESRQNIQLLNRSVASSNSKRKFRSISQTAAAAARGMGQRVDSQKRNFSENREFIDSSSHRLNKILSSCVVLQSEQSEESRGNDRRQSLDFGMYFSGQTSKQALYSMSASHAEGISEIKERLVNDNDIEEKTDLNNLAVGVKVSKYLQDIQTKTDIKNQIDSEKLRYKKELLKHKMETHITSNPYQQTIVNQLKRSLARDRRQSRAFLTSQDNSFSKLVNTRDFIGFK